jgi:hypothetical protein
VTGRRIASRGPLILALFATGCTHRVTVDREYDARVVEGRFIEPEAYAAFLRGAIAEASGDSKEALAAYARAERVDPGGPEIVQRIDAVRCAGNPNDATADEARARAIGPDRAIGLRALATWARTHGDVTLWAGTLVMLARIAPLQRDDIAGSAEVLAGMGAGGQARAVAGAAADASDEPPSSGTHPLAWRLAVDDAIASRDARAVWRRATRTHLALDEVAARALLAGEIEMASDIASTVFRADPRDGGARLVLAAVGGRDALADAARLRNHPNPGPVSAAAWVAFARALAGAGLVEGSRAAAGMAHDAMLAGDELVVRPAVELASRGLIDPAALSPDGRIELRVRRSADAAEGPVPLPAEVEGHPPGTVTE